MAAEKDRQPRIVAELGRPETADETAARKAENSRKHRANQTLRNLVFALLACLAVVLVLVLVVVRPDGAPRAAVDYRADASASEPRAGHTLAAPELPTGWSANDDGLTTGSDSVLAWKVGFITPSTQYIGLVQGINANPTWVSNELVNTRSTGSISIGGQDWAVYDRRTEQDPGNYAYSLSTVIGVSSIVLHGTGSAKEFTTLASAVVAQLAGSTG
ncbi:DUF4245 domain-containing protein [Frigoribacterium sp. CG_9.8]|uniref:DUF4245 domain-containing protein n=1 Tax=Frigoribacterium sp. CG_9.8 TaxID=2787733 RepID=UPI0018C8E5EE|nr:hypothetical protein [Frigoribacterium sp. CG_9.8]